MTKLRPNVSVPKNKHTDMDKKRANKTLNTLLSMSDVNKTTPNFSISCTIKKPVIKKIIA